eukprot:403358316
MPPKKQKQAKKGQKPLDIVGDALADKIANQIDEDATQANTSAGASQEPTPTSQRKRSLSMYLQTLKKRRLKLQAPINPLLIFMKRKRKLKKITLK